MDNLARSAMLARQKGMSYGRYQALYGKPVEPKKEQKKEKPERWLICPWCNKEFKAKTNQKYCDLYCQSEANKQRARDRKAAKKNEST